MLFITLFSDKITTKKLKIPQKNEKKNVIDEVQSTVGRGIFANLAGMNTKTLPL